MQFDFIFKMTNDYKRHEECLQTLHNFSYRVIRERKEQIKKEEAKKLRDTNNNFDENGNEMDEDDVSLGKKKRLAFLDLLITASADGAVLTDEDIREEVDTFVSCITDHPNRLVVSYASCLSATDVRGSRHDKRRCFMVLILDGRQSGNTRKGSAGSGRDNGRRSAATTDDEGTQRHEVPRVLHQRGSAALPFGAFDSETSQGGRHDW